MKLSLKAWIAAAGLSAAIGFLVLAALNALFPPYGGGWLAVLTSIYPGYDPVSGPSSIIVGALYSLLAGVLAGLIFGWLYNFFATRW